MRFYLYPTAFLLLQFGALAHIDTARAAVRVCYPSVSSDVMKAKTELDAKQLALLQWQERASKYGAALDAWRLAYEKALKCDAKDNGFECVAVGQPCIIRNNPNLSPAGKDGKGEPL